MKINGKLIFKWAKGFISNAYRSITGKDTDKDIIILK